MQLLFFMQYLQFTFNVSGREQSEILIALLSDIGFNGFEEDENKLKAFTPISSFDEILFNKIMENVDVKYFKSTINEVNWNEKWEAGFEPVTVLESGSSTPFCHIRASFHQNNPEAIYNIEVTPKMSFGTGHHATTYMMIAAMSQLLFKNKTVLDFGTGTGVLAILAEKMGAKNIIAIDNDDWSISNAKENLQANLCSKIELIKADSLSGNIEAEIILANINLNVIIANLSKIKECCTANTVILLSGLLAENKGEIVVHLNKNGLEVVKFYERQNWIAIEAVCPGE